MCSIYGARFEDKYQELKALNCDRGTENPSRFTLYNDAYTLTKDNVDFTGKKNFRFVIGHVQAPTSEFSGQHPAMNDDFFLYHNGILVEGSFPENTWDTQHILNTLGSDLTWSNLSDLHGSFACILIQKSNRKIFMFRNSLAPLWVDDKNNFSSVKFEGSIMMEPNIIFELDYFNRSRLYIEKFNTKHAIYG